MVTTSYVSEGMRKLDEVTKQKGLLFLNELGVDPGIDHMSAMKIIDEIHAEGGKILHFYSYCGGLPAPKITIILLATSFHGVQESCFSFA